MLKSRYFMLVFFLFLTTLLGATQVFELLEQSDTGLTLRFTQPAWNLEQGEKDQFVNTKTETFLGEHGSPALPVYAVSFALPATGTVDVTYQADETKTVDGVSLEPWYNESLNPIIAPNPLVYTKGQNYPQQQLRVNRPGIMRGIRVGALSIVPFTYNHSNHTLQAVQSVTIRVNFNRSQPGENELTGAPRPVSAAFEQIAAQALINYTPRTQRDITAQPHIVYVYPDNATVLQYLQALGNWRVQCGYKVTYASTNVTGTSITDIKSYLQNAYDNWEAPPDYVIMCGDGSGSYSLPVYYRTLGSYTAEGDHAYGMLDGDDEIEDVFLSRITYNTTDQLLAMVSRILLYEMTPLLDDESNSWYNRNLLVGDTSMSGISTVSTNKLVKEEMMRYEPLHHFTEQYGNRPSPQGQNAALDEGVLYWNFRGWAGMSGWSSSTYASSLTNGRMMPVCVVITCNTGTFASGNAVTENIVRSGTASSPNGGICAIGGATNGTHTAYNNTLDGGIFHGLFTFDLPTMGQAIQYGKFVLWQTYNESQPNTMQFFVHNNTLMGDAALQVYKTYPKSMTVSYPATITNSNSQFFVEVSSDTGAVEGAKVTLTQGSTQITGSTNQQGQVWLDVADLNAGAVTITTVKPGYVMEQGSLTVGNTGYELDIINYTINGQGGADAGENITLNVQLQNTGSYNLSSVTGQISLLDTSHATVTDANGSWGSIDAGTTTYATNTFGFSIDPEYPGGTDILVKLVISGSAGYQTTKLLSIPVGGANMQVKGYLIQAGNGELDPDETVQLQVYVENTGTASATGITGVLSCQHPDITINNANANWNNISANNYSLSSGFNVSAGNIIPGSIVNFNLNLSTSAGATYPLSFNLQVGQAGVTDPLGPDSYGYYIIDSYDSMYDSCPAYGWDTISSTGTNLGISDTGDDGDEVVVVDLPFDFSFYGQHFYQISVCSNGWLAMGATEQITFRNYHVPGALGPTGMIAPFWDDLKTSSVYGKYDAVNHCYIVEWYNARNFYDNSTETFQVKLYDQDYHTTATGDGEILILYNTVNNIDQGGGTDHGEYATVGIEDPTGTIGLEYTFNNEYPAAARPLEDRLALLITTNKPDLLGLPDLSFDTTSVNFSAAVNGTDTTQMTIGNTGQGNLVYNTNVVYQFDLPTTRDSGGPDAFGYTWVDSDEEGGIAFNWVDITQVGEELHYSTYEDDKTDVGLQLGFPFTFYGNTYTTVNLCNNGFLSFTSEDDDYTNTQLPDLDTPNNLIAPFWDDMSPQQSGSIHYYQDTANNRFIVQFTSVPHYSSTSGTYTFECILYADGSILFQYLTMIDVTSAASIGIENIDGSDGLQIAYNENYVHDGLAVLISTKTQWLTLEPAYGTILGGQQQTITLTADAEDMESGTYNCNVTLTSNDPSTPTVTIPVSFTVGQPTGRPMVPQNVQIFADATMSFLWWDPVTTDINGNNLQVSGYNVYRVPVGQAMQVNQQTLIATVSATNYTDTTPGEFIYVVTAISQ